MCFYKGSSLGVAATTQPQYLSSMPYKISGNHPTTAGILLSVTKLTLKVNLDDDTYSKIFQMAQSVPRKS